MKIEQVAYKGWKNNIRLANKQVELIITRDVGPRIIRFGFIGKDNIFANLPGQMGKKGEKKWMIRGGHRLWVAPEDKPRSYELDNSPVEIKKIKSGIKVIQKPGPVTHIQKSMEITLADRSNTVTVLNGLTNRGKRPFELAPWALTVMALRGVAIIPLPKFIAHTDRLTHNQNWSLWGYTDFSDPRWTLGSRYIFFRQDPKRNPNKLGMAQREGWVAYHHKKSLFIKRFRRVENAVYPDGGVNFETFSNQEILELETLGPLVKLMPGKTVTHKEIWSLHYDIPECRTAAAVDRYVRPLV